MRYPGSKKKHAETLLQYVPTDVVEWAEPFAGGLSMTLAVARRQRLESIMVNDLDYGMYAMWFAIAFDIEQFEAWIDEYVPRAEDFYEFRSTPNTGQTSLDGFHKLVLHQISYSGMGAKAGSPIGGRNQTGKYLVDCRWNPTRLKKWAREAHDLFAQADFFSVANSDWSALEDNEFVYLDPPYYSEGGGLYLHGGLDHEQLAATLRERDRPWLLSYDDHPEIHRLYEDFATIEPYPVTSHLHHKTVVDVIITPKELHA